MNPNMFLPGDWADASGWVVMMIVLAVILVGLALKMVAGLQWDDWLDELSHYFRRANHACRQCQHVCHEVRRHRSIGIFDVFGRERFGCREWNRGGRLGGRDGGRKYYIL